MHFFDYQTLQTYVRQRETGYGLDVDAARLKPDDFRRKVIYDVIMRTRNGISCRSDRHVYDRVKAEACWLDCQRPYYNVWPIALELAHTVTLNVRVSQIHFPFQAMLLRFPRGRTTLGIRTAIAQCTAERIDVICDGDDYVAYFSPGFKKDESVEEFLERTAKKSSIVDGDVIDTSDARRFVIRLLLFISMLAQGEDLITPVVLAKDRTRYAKADDDAKRWIEDRAARRAGRGFDVAKRLQIEKESSPHWRNPHLCLFWTGEGRKKPVIKMRSGAIVERISMAAVPTGYLGPETDEEDSLVLDEESTPRGAISKRRRFEILKRDGYQCQLCGAASSDGAKLHIDHKMPLAKGGSNDDENLWTLCQSCNLGKSDVAL